MIEKSCFRIFYLSVFSLWDYPCSRQVSRDSMSLRKKHFIEKNKSNFLHFLDELLRDTCSSGSITHLPSALWEPQAPLKQPTSDFTQTCLNVQWLQTLGFRSSRLSKLKVLTGHPAKPSQSGQSETQRVVLANACHMAGNCAEWNWCPGITQPVTVYCFRAFADSPCNLGNFLWLWCSNFLWNKRWGGQCMFSVLYGGLCTLLRLGCNQHSAPWSKAQSVHYS